MASQGTTSGGAQKQTTVAVSPKGKDVARDAVLAAYLEERDVLFEIAALCLDFMAYVERYQEANRDQGAESTAAVMARGRMFTALHKAHQGNLRKRILQARESVDQKQRDYQRKFMKGRDDARL